MKLSEMEQTVRTKQKNAITALEAKIASMEEQIDGESRYARVNTFVLLILHYV